MRAFVGVGVLLCGLLGAEAAQARVQINVDLSSQTMHVNGDGADYDWPVSTARAGYATPRGHYHAGHLERMHYSRKYHMSPMPYSIFFAGGYAIHGTYETGFLGRPASHGCIRLSPGHAEILYGMVQEQGADIQITGSAPRSFPFSRSLRRHREVRPARAPRAEVGYGGASGDGWASPAPLSYAPARRSVVPAGAGRMMNPFMRPDF
ncbi:MAG: L,D-transpeptidase [Methylocella sp.]